MLEHLDIRKILFLDIETVSQFANYSDVPERFQKLWDHKASLLAKNDEAPDEIYDRAGIYSEFGKIVCISVGAIRDKDGERQLWLKSFAGDDEKQLLQDFAEMLNKNYATDQHQVCGHNGKEFDFPYIARRMLVWGVKIPRILDTAGKKPWEVNHLDTMQLWKFGDYKSFTSLNLLAAIFDIPTPKDDIDGSQVGAVYWKEKNLERIVVYCQKDVLTLVQVFLKLLGQPLLQTENVHEV